MIVVQIRSLIDAGSQMQSAARSLGLKGMASASLRNSRDKATLGNVRIVRDYVSVIRLGGVQFKESGNDAGEDGKLQFERPEYGSATQPAQLVRSNQGDYYAYESDAQNTLLMWSAARDLPSILELADLVSPEPIEPTLPCFISAHLGGEAMSENMSFSDVARSLSEDSFTLAFLQIPLQNFEITWRKAYQRFHDRDTTRAELSLYVPNDFDADQIRRFVRGTGSRRFFAASDCVALVRRKGRRAEVSI